MSNLNVDPSDGDSLNMAHVFGMLILDSVLYLIIAWYVSGICLHNASKHCVFRYIDAVFPGQFGVPRKPYFFLLPSYWFGRNHTFKKVPRPRFSISGNSNFDVTTLSSLFKLVDIG